MKPSISFVRRFLPWLSAPAPASDWRATLTRRLGVLAIIGLVWAIAIVGRLVQLEIFQYQDLLARRERQRNRVIEAVAKRGDIVDRNGRVLAMSADADSIYAVPSEVDAKDRAAWSASTAAKVCAALRDCAPGERKTLVERLDRQSPFVYVRRFVEPAQAARVSEAGLAAIGFLKESRRFYPGGELAGHVLGYVGTEHKGLSGIEAAYNKLIAGVRGSMLVQVDATGRVFSRAGRPPTPGASLELTLDTYLQHLAERELHAGVVANRAAGGTVIIMNPHTGEILAMANEPTFDPNEYRDSSETERRNRAVQDLYEPGSTFKLVTASAAMQDGVMPIDTLIDVSGGRIAIGSRVVHDDHQYGVLSFADVIIKSSNVGAIKIGFKVGTERLSDYVRRFGFGKPASPDFPAESPGIVWDADKWTDSALASVSMGYQVGVTPLQMVTAASVVANGGQLMEPRVVGAVYRDGLRYPVRPKVVRRVIDANTAASLTTIMEGVVTDGTAKAARIAGYAVAGKTGTAAKLVGGRYSKSEYNASFVGFVPSRNPALAIIVVTDAPHAGTYYGGSVSAPVFKRIAEGAIRYLGVPHTIDPAPALLVTKAEPMPPAAAVVQPAVNEQQNPADVVPDVTGLSAREAARTLAQFGLSARLVGDGVVLAQSPAAGSSLQAGTEGRLVLGRLQARHGQDTAVKP